MTNQKNVCCYTSTYTVSSFSHNSRNSRLMFVLTPALSWFTRKTQQKKSEALSQVPEPLQRHKPLIPGSLGSYSAQVFLFSQIVCTDLATSNENAKRAERPGCDFRCSICRSAMGQDSCLICASRCQLTSPFCCWTKLHATTLEPFRFQDEECTCVIQRPFDGKT